MNYCGINTMKLKVANGAMILIFFVSLALINFGCGAYSFTGSSVPSHLKTIYIPVAQDRSVAAIPGLRELLTDDLIQRFIQDNSLQVSNATSADATLDCMITSVTDIPAIVSAGEQINARKLTINVKVVYKDLVVKKTIFDQNFSSFGEYVPGQQVNEREEAIAVAVGHISEDILPAVLSGW